MAIKGSNMIVRVGADMSGLIGEFKKSGRATENFAKQASDALRQATLSEANLKKAMAQGGKNSYIVNLTDQIRELEQEQKALKAAGFGWGYEGFENNEILLESLKNELNDYVRSVRDAGKETEDTGAKIKKLGSASQQSNAGIKSTEKALSGVKSNAKNAHIGVDGLLRSIRRLGVVSLGLRFVRSLFGELGSIVRQYVSENSALQAQVNALKASMGQALAPAINIVTNALSRLMPYIVGVSNAIGSLVSSLFGSGWANLTADANAATKAIGGAGGAAAALNRQLHGFDEITKVNEKSGGGGGGLSSAIESVTGIVPEGLTSFIEKIKESIAKGDWEGVGITIAELLNGGMAKLSSADVTLGSTIATWINNGVLLAKGFIQNFDWSELGDLVAKNLVDVIMGIDYAALSELTGSLTGLALTPNLWVFQKAGEGRDILKNGFAKYYEEHSEEYKSVGSAILGLIWEGVVDANKKIKENLMTPFIEGFKKSLGINTSIDDLLEIGRNILAVILRGLLEFANSPTEWLRTNVFNPISQALQSLFDGTKVGDFTVGVKNSASEWWQNVKTWWAQKVGAGKKFTTDVENNSTTWWKNVKQWWSEKVGGVQYFTTGPKDDKTTWWQSVKTWWAQVNGKVDPFGVDPKNDATSWWDSVKRWWNGAVDKLSVGISIKNEAATWWENVKSWWALNVGSLSTKLKIDLPKIEVTWSDVTKLGITFPVPSFSLKWNATGAILNGAQLFGMLGNTLLGGGEAGREALLPLDRHTGWMDDIADRVAARIGGVGTQEQQITVNVPLDGKILASTVVRVINGQARATGHNPLSAWI